MGTTINFGFPFPEDDDDVDVPGDMEDLAVAISLAIPVVSAKKSITAVEQSRTNSSYGYFGTPDRVNVKVPTDGLIVVAFQALWIEEIEGAARAAIFVNDEQVASRGVTDATAQETSLGQADQYSLLNSSPLGLVSEPAASDLTTDVDTGSLIVGSDGLGIGGVCHIMRRTGGGDFDVGVKFKASSGTVWAKDRWLAVWTMKLT